MRSRISRDMLGEKSSATCNVLSRYSFNCFFRNDDRDDFELPEQGCKLSKEGGKQFSEPASVHLISSLKLRNESAFAYSKRF